MKWDGFDTSVALRTNNSDQGMAALVRTTAKAFPAAFSGQQQRFAHSYISQSKNIDPLVEDIFKRLQPLGLGVSFLDVYIVYSSSICCNV